MQDEERLYGAFIKVFKFSASSVKQKCESQKVFILQRFVTRVSNIKQFTSKEDGTSAELSRYTYFCLLHWDICFILI